MLFAAHGYREKKYRKKMLLEKNKCYLRHTGTIWGKKIPGPPQFSKMHNCLLRHMPALSICSSDRVTDRHVVLYIRHMRRAQRRCGTCDPSW